MTFTRHGSLLSLLRLVSFGFLLQWQFPRCDGVCTIEPDAQGHVHIDNSTWFDIPPYAFAGCAPLVSVYISDGIKLIGISAFNGCGNLRTVRLPDDLEEIGDSAFHENHSLEEIKLPSTLIKTGTSIFYQCASLTELSIPGSLKNVSKEFCRRCKGIKTLIIEEGVEEIGPQAFSIMSSLKNVSLPSSLMRIREKAFEQNALLELNSLPESVVKIDDSAFELCSKLTNMTFPPKLGAIPLSSFSQCALESIVIPEGTKHVWPRAFAFQGISEGGLSGPFLQDVTFLSEDEIHLHESAFAVNPLLKSARFHAEKKVKIWDGVFAEASEQLQLYFKTNLTQLGGVPGYSCQNKQCNCAKGYGNVLYGNEDEADFFSCVECPSGYTSGGDQGECAKCESGTYTETKGTAVCTPCEAGKASDVEGAISSSVCKPCVSGEYAPAPGASTCIPCPPGTFCDKEGMFIYSRCSPGRYTSLDSQTDCLLCPTGKYEPGFGSAVCQDCPRGKYLNYPSATSIGDCLNCTAGRYGDQLGLPACLTCATGAYQAKEGMSSCIDCTTQGSTMTNSEDHRSCEVNQALLFKNTPEQSLVDLMFSNGVAVYASFIISAIFTAVFAAMQYLRENEGPDKLGQVQRFHLVPKVSLPSLSFGSEMFLIIAIFSQSPALGAFMLTSRLSHLVSVIFIMTCLFAGKKAAPYVKMVVEDADTWKDHLHSDFTKKHIPVVAVVCIFSMADVSMIQMLPWTPSTFYSESVGFPCKSLMRFCLGIDTVQASVSVLCQLIYLGLYNNVNNATTKPEAKALFALNITSGLIMVVMGVVMLFLKERLLKMKKGQQEEEEAEMGGGSRRGSAVVELSGVYDDHESQGEQFSNPLHDGGQGSSTVRELRDRVTSLERKLEQTAAKAGEMEHEVAIKNEEITALRRRIPAKDKEEGGDSANEAKAGQEQL